MCSAAGMVMQDAMQLKAWDSDVRLGLLEGDILQKTTDKGVLLKVVPWLGAACWAGHCVAGSAWLSIAPTTCQRGLCNT